MDRMREEIGKGHSILAFPEGTRTVDGRVGPFRKGVFFIARDLGIPIVPVSLTGTFELMRKGSYVLRPGHEITVYCDKPIPTAGVPDHEIGDLAEEVRRVIAGRIDGYWEERAKEQR
jgi:1-acyl-sn-glycerol-3-phosphate acyltransferase